ncbi:MAG: DNA cytosine methyltransferase, partial [Anaerolineae bacterium]|nr:DNA cytosine methyltransferase [Anaerolineae bacterium]
MLNKGIPTMYYNSQSPTVVDLFCGCGGLSLGFQNAGFKIILGVDNWEDALCTFSHNHSNAKTLLDDLSDAVPKHLFDGLDKNAIDIIVGGPP